MDKFEHKISQHNIVQRLGATHELSTDRSTVMENVDKIAKETKHYMTNAGKKCHESKSGRIPFSPDSVVWIRHSQVYRSILRYHACLIYNRGNLKHGKGLWNQGLFEALVGEE